MRLRALNILVIVALIGSASIAMAQLPVDAESGDANNAAVSDPNSFDMATVKAKTLEFVYQAVDIWKTGGWAMPAIALNALLMFGIGCNVYLRLRAKGFDSVPEKTWRQWIDHPEQRRGNIGQLLDYVTGTKSLDDLSVSFDELRQAEVVPFERDLRVMRICVSAAPLLGLLGTVTGMLATFDALASGSGGDQTMDLVAKGISEALVTTETGLIIALPGLFFQYQMTRKHEKYRAFLAHVETVCTQIKYHELEAQKAA